MEQILQEYDLPKELYTYNFTENEHILNLI